MVENDRSHPGLIRRVSARIKASRLSRRMRRRHTLRAVQQRERADGHHRSGEPIAAPRLWQRYLLVPVVTLIRGIRNGLVWLRTVVLPAPAPVLDVDPAQCLIVGHRGACAAAVENTLESCERAVEVEGADAVEIDLCVTQDGQVVVWHDWDPDALVAVARQAEAEPFVLCRPVAPP